MTSLGYCAPLGCGARASEPTGYVGSEPQEGDVVTTPPGEGGRPVRGGTVSPTGSRGGGAQPTAGEGSVPAACDSPTPLGGGWELCANGVRHRAAIVGECASGVPRAGMAFDPITYGVGAPLTDAGVPDLSGFRCISDTDCNERAQGHCELGQIGPYCVYGCVTDADCAADQACLCGEPVGQCVPAACRVDSDCSAGLLCADYLQQPFCGGPALACQSRNDECVGTADCETCTIEEGNRHRTCSSSVCIIGRPFLVAGAERLASAAPRADWLSDSSIPADDPGPALREALASAWTEQALMEHASVAAFARFALQLMSLGAPAELLERTTRAMADETRHAQLCFSLARRYSGKDVGPGPLSMDGALDASDLTSIVLTTVHEGCIGETVAAIEAAEALAHCEDTATRGVLSQIARDEAEHAELAWRFVTWAVERWPELGAAVRAELARALEDGRRVEGTAPRSPTLEPSERDAALLEHGIVSSSVRAALRLRVLSDVVLPCAEALLSPSDGAGEGARRSSLWL